MKRLTLTLSIAFLWAASAWAAQATLLTQLSVIHTLTNAQASEGIPVRFEATVTYYRIYEHTLFVQDGDAAIYVAAPPGIQLELGDRIQVQGKTLNSFNPIIVDASIKVLRHGAIPTPLKASFNQMISAETDCRLVTARGVIRSADLMKSIVAEDSFIRLQLLTDGGYFTANLDVSDPSALEGLLDAEVEVTGVASEQFDDKMQDSGILLHVQALADIKILKRPNSDPWKLPITQMDRVLAVYHIDETTPRIRVHGTITYYLPGSAVVLQDGAKSIWITTQTYLPLRIGDEADAIGFSDVHDGFLNIVHGEIRDTMKFAPIQPLQATGLTLTPLGTKSPGHHDDLVSIEGRVVTEVNEDSQDELVLDADGRQFSAINRHPFGKASTFHGVPVGARVRVTGICLLEYSNPYIDQVPFTILLRGVDDVEVVARPSLINTRNLLIALALLLLVVFAVLGRGWSLEHKMRRQSAAMSALREAEAGLERQRSRILEDINGARPLTEILEEITRMISLTLGGIACWCELADGSILGVHPPDLMPLRMVGETISARAGSALGTFKAGLDANSPITARESEVLQNGARLATLAIETRRLYSDLRRRSEYDLLTDIPNRFAMEKFMDLQIEIAHSSEAIFGLIYIDLDKFKPINDRYGHHVGDLYLQAVALRMSKQLLGGDMLARLGGDEFAALVSLHHGRSDMDAIVARLAHCFDEPYAIESHFIQGEASIGYALYPQDGATRDELLIAADNAMYSTKNAKKKINESTVGNAVA